MEQEKVRITLRIPAALNAKIEHIAHYEYRPKNREIEQLIKRRVAAFEEKHGEIRVRK